MSDNFKDLYFTHNTRDVGLVFDFIFFKYFNGYFFICKHMGSFTHFAKGSLSDGVP
jgi:hypothetical protein